jgi:hypothetical protein
MSGQAAEYAQDYAWEKIATQIEAVYKDLVPEESKVDRLSKLNGNF